MNEALRDALEAVKSGQPQRARVILADYLRDDPQNVPAWVLLSKLATTEGQKTAFLRKILDLNPDHAYARQVLAEMGAAQPPAAALSEPSASDRETVEAPETEQREPGPAGSSVEGVIEEDRATSQPAEPPVIEDQAALDAGLGIAAGEEDEPAWLDTEAREDEVSDEGLASWLDSDALDEEESEEELASWLDSDAHEDEESEEELASWLNSEAVDEEELEEDFASWLDSDALEDEESEEELASWLDSEALDEEELEEDFASWLDSDALEDEESEEDFAGWLDSEALGEEESDEELGGWLGSEATLIEESEEEALPSWLDAEALGQQGIDESEDTLLEAPAPPSPQEEVAEQDLSGRLWEDDDEWLVSEEDEDVVGVTGAVASEKAARLSAAMSEAAPRPSLSEEDAGSGRRWLLATLIFVAAVVFLLLVYAVLTFLL